MIIIIGGIKGGVGKSTISCQFAQLNAANGRKTLLVDADPNQGSTTRFSENRQAAKLETLFTTIQLQDKQLLNELPRLAKGYDDIVVDVPGKDSNGQRCALMNADILLTPIPPRYFELATVTQIDDLVEMSLFNNAKLKWFVFRNMSYPKNKDNDAALEFLQELELSNGEILEHQISNRKAFSDAITEGKGVWERDKANEKAIKELVTIYEAVFNQKVQINNLYKNV